MAIRKTFDSDRHSVARSDRRLDSSSPGRLLLSRRIARFSRSMLLEAASTLSLSLSLSLVSPIARTRTSETTSQRFSQRSSRQDQSLTDRRAESRIEDLSRSPRTWSVVPPHGRASRHALRPFFARGASRSAILAAKVRSGDLSPSGASFRARKIRREACERGYRFAAVCRSRRGIGWDRDRKLEPNGAPREDQGTLARRGLVGRAIDPRRDIVSR